MCSGTSKSGHSFILRLLSFLVPRAVFSEMLEGIPSTSVAKGLVTVDTSSIVDWRIMAPGLCLLVEVKVELGAEALPALTPLSSSSDPSSTRGVYGKGLSAAEAPGDSGAWTNGCRGLDGEPTTVSSLLTVEDRLISEFDS
jgi:hypothetical protein